MDSNLKIVLMMPARSGSQRLRKKNLMIFNGAPLVLHNLNKAKNLSIFDKIYINTESSEIGEICKAKGFEFYKRNKKLADNKTTSEDFVYDFLIKVPCDYLIQLHSIAPLIKPEEIMDFVETLVTKPFDTLLSCKETILESVYLGKPINFNFDQKTNSQELTPIQTVSWAITGWKRETYLRAYEEGSCATYSGRIGFFTLSNNSNHVIKTEDDFELAEMLLMKERKHEV